MNKLIYFTIIVFSSITVAQAQCNEYYALENNSEWEMENYNGKGKLTSRTEQKVTSYQKTGTGFESILSSIIYNEKGKEQTRGEFKFTCANGTAIIDMRSFVTEDQLKSFKNFEMKVESENLEVPSKLTVGQTLKDGSITMTAVNSGLPMKTTVTLTDRKVEGKESITTPAGTFECFKLSAKMLIKSQFGVTMNLEFTTNEWLALKVGSVKSESYNKNGKLVGYSILSKRKG